MHNFTKAMLAALMLVGFSTNVFAEVDCTGLNHYNGKAIKSGLAWGGYMQGPSSHDQCLTFNENGRKGNYVDALTGEIRYQNKTWDGVVRYQNQSVATEGNAVLGTTDVKALAESGGFYAVLKQFGPDSGLVKIKAYLGSIGTSQSIIAEVEKHLRSLSYNEFERLASLFDISDGLKKFLRNKRGRYPF
jgi:hypothetical protein